MPSLYEHPNSQSVSQLRKWIYGAHMTDVKTSPAFRKTPVEFKQGVPYKRKPTKLSKIRMRNRTKRSILKHRKKASLTLGTNELPI